MVPTEKKMGKKLSLSLFHSEENENEKEKSLPT